MIAFLKFQLRDGYGDIQYKAGDKVKVTKIKKVLGDRQSWYTDGSWAFPRCALIIPRKKKK
jgi:hypothetical protein